MADRYDIVVSGASGAGLLLALALDRLSGSALRIAIVERAAIGSSSRPDARAYAISAASRNMLDRLGVWAPIADASQPVTAIEITDSELNAGIRPVILTYDNTTPDNLPATHIIPTDALMRAVLERVRGCGSISILAPDEITSVERGEQALTVRLASIRALTTPLLVSAEGKSSPLRALFGIGVTQWTGAQTGIVTTVAHERPHNATAVQHFLPAGPFAILPLPGNRSCITWSEAADEARRILALDDAQFLDALDKRFGGRLGTLELAGPRQSWPLDMHLARAYVAPRFALIGDAAHGVHPIAGQGLNLAIRDAAALAEVVIDAASLGLDIGALDTLENYQRWRRFDSTLSAVTFDSLNRLFSNDNTLLRAARDAGLGLVDRLPGLKQMFVNEAAGLSGELPKLLKGAAA